MAASRCRRSGTSLRPSNATATPGTPAIDVALRFLAAAAAQRTGSAAAACARRAWPTRLSTRRSSSSSQHGLVDDAAFAQYWLEQRQTFRPRGARLVRAELRQHGIAADLADGRRRRARAEPLPKMPTAPPQKRASHLAAADERAFKTRLGQFLARRGFDWDTIAPVVERL